MDKSSEKSRRFNLFEAGGSPISNSEEHFAWGSDDFHLNSLTHSYTTFSTEIKGKYKNILQT